MHPRQIPSPALLRLAEAQPSALSREQVLGLGLSRHALARLVAEGRWCRLTEGIVSTTPRPEWLTLAWTGLLVAGDRARLGGAAAAHLIGLVDAAPDEIVVWSPADAPTRQPPPPYRWRFRVDRHGVRGTGAAGHPPRIRATDVVLDLVEETGADRLTDLVTTAVQRRVVTAGQLRRAAGRRSLLRHRALLGDVLDDVATGTQSPLERRFLRDVERAHGLPAGLRQVRRAGTVADVLYAAFGLLVELDGRIGHDGAGRFRDMRRDNRALRDGLVTLRYGWSDVTGRPCAVAAEVGSVLHRLGWDGTPDRCPRC
ncbi:very-short-patch-repair endonuclease [Friedmanniella endophytica]|uniref:Very-short-patch-repair endonuclease n=1 Tax=Microlunatus kandeliicorticis TaxID=1759536 RepID=A0A7W3INQ1_9ACTN|nr:type IV toxin-antitoxin system AbiEi family antitoxin domain-containing protein [Microlunatus kandeliicorticis]MBA8792438.1 very-short-patch-repair endonuclease [Microlunatus kandeliicorticis]